MASTAVDLQSITLKSVFCAGRGEYHNGEERGVEGYRLREWETVVKTTLNRAWESRVSERIFRMKARIARIVCFPVPIRGRV